jgi:hypothetical protein
VIRDSRQIIAWIIEFCLIRQSSVVPIAIPRRTRIGSVNAHDSVHYFNRPVDRSITNLAVQFRLGILPKWRPGLATFDIVDLRADGTRLSERFKEIGSENPFHRANPAADGARLNAGKV